MKVLSGSKIHELTAQELYEQIGARSSVVTDVGTGSGRYVLAGATADPNSFFIGIDPVPENMKQNSQRASKLARKRVLSNLLYVIASIETLPSELQGLSDIVTVTLPWGSLRDGIVLCDPTVLGNLRGLGKSGTQLTIIIGYDEQNEAVEMEKRNLPQLSAQLFASLADSYLQAGIRLESVSVLNNQALRNIQSDWAKRLAFGKRRQMYKLICTYI